MFARFSSCLLIPVLFLVAGSIAGAQEVECPLIADTMMSGHSTEYETNCGGRTSLRVKGFQGVVVFRFDMSSLEGQRAEGGTFTAYCKSITGEAQGKSYSEKISTIAHDWIEGTGDYTPSEDSATYSWPGKDIAKSWGKDNDDPTDRYGPIDVLDVINGYSESILNSEGIWDFVVGEWTDIELDAELVQGLIDGEQYGIVVWRDTVGVNLDLSSREDAGGQFAAKLVVRGSGKAVNAHGKLTSTWAGVKAQR